MQESELSGMADKLNCAFCRNPLTMSSKVNINPYEGDFVSVFCDDCNKRYKDNKNLGPKFLICLCGDKPKELDMDMGKEEIKAQLKEMKKPVEVVKKK